MVRPMSRLLNSEVWRKPGTASQEAVTQTMTAGQAALERGDLEKAVAVFSDIARQFPDLGAAHAALGTALLSAERFVEAEPALRRASQLAPASPHLHNQLGVALFRLGNLSEAESAFRQARQAAPDDVQSLLNLTELYRSQQQYVEATDAIKEALKSHADQPDVLVTFGTLSLELGDTGAAAVALRRLEKVQPDHEAVSLLHQILEAQRV
jgi:Flp pilus assembly protein TadD